MRRSYFAPNLLAQILLLAVMAVILG